MDVTKWTTIKKIKSNEIQWIEDMVVIEYPLTIFLNDIELITLLATPRSLKELAVGFLLSEGFIDGMDEIESIKLYENEGCIYVNSIKDKDIRIRLKGKRTITSGCGKGTSFYNVLDTFKDNKVQSHTTIKKEVIINLTREFNSISELFQETGGVHCVALCDDNNIVFFEEDIGRHNALDKVFGRGHMEKMDFRDKFILTTGRVSSEILIKAAKRQIFLVASRSAPTQLSVDLAKELGICLIGFVRGDKMNIYSSFDRVII